jgi:hypothetical protein
VLQEQGTRPENDLIYPQGFRDRPSGPGLPVQRGPRVAGRGRRNSCRP